MSQGELYIGPARPRRPSHLSADRGLLHVMSLLPFPGLVPFALLWGIFLLRAEPRKQFLNSLRELRELSTGANKLAVVTKRRVGNSRHPVKTCFFQFLN